MQATLAGEGDRHRQATAVRTFPILPPNRDQLPTAPNLNPPMVVTVTMPAQRSWVSSAAASLAIATESLCYTRSMRSADSYWERFEIRGALIALHSRPHFNPRWLTRSLQTWRTSLGNL